MTAVPHFWLIFDGCPTFLKEGSKIWIKNGEKVGEGHSFELNLTSICSCVRGLTDANEFCDEPFHNFGAIKFVVRLSWTTVKSSVHELFASKSSGIVEFYEVLDRRSTNFKASKLRKGSSGSTYFQRDMLTFLHKNKPFSIWSVGLHLSSISFLLGTSSLYRFQS